MAIKTILVPTDGSPLAERALRHAVEEYAEADITVFHAIDFRSSESYPGGWGEAAGTWEEWLGKARTETETLFERTRAVAMEFDHPVETASTVGPAARSILDYLESHNFDLVVMGSHGRPLVSRILLGSVAETVTRRSPCPVVVVR